ncbi:formate--tetrahydrofolate ligase [Sediminitomix flava]|uniref:Formate--tetrahydrofolate ligase n=1 Tax=Sediminitomix flava TaxID=379075 RepID=A0A315ZEN3_SEDFL|nr:formate--tetrahydrofolate ligase [Sediminitomix flava]PWJ44025.1 formate-tetrahydrofolate ligase [Sediminitomix flava]
MKTDIQIARETTLLPISAIAEKIGIQNDDLIPYGKYIAKVPHQLAEKKDKKGKLILVSAITPTKAGIGKTTVSIGLSLGLEKIGKKTVVALREPSLGPCFGMKGGAAGGGYAQVLPMENINLHFTGDFHAITSAHNMISALLDNYQFQNKGTDKQLKQIVWKRVLDVNDRSLRNIVTGMGGISNGIPTESGFDITPASEIMAIFCLSKDIEDLRNRIDNILLGYTHSNDAFYVKDLNISGAITVLLKDALDPNLVQTTEHSAAFVHGGPFANIAHGCNSVIATKVALNHGDYVITEAGFGADLGAEKFLNIKCRAAGISPSASVLVATSQALKMHGGVDEKEIKQPNAEGLRKGLENVKVHVENLKNFGQTVILTFNKYYFDTEEEIQLVKDWATDMGIRFAINNSFVEGGEGAVNLAQTVVDAIEEDESKPLSFTYELEDSIETKIEKVAKSIYRAKDIELSNTAQLRLKRIKRLGFENLPICIAKTQYSFSDDAKAYGAVKDHTLHIEDFVINSGAGFIVVIAGNIMRMPGLPKEPQALHIDLVDGQIEGLS